MVQIRFLSAALLQVPVFDVYGHPLSFQTKKESYPHSVAFSDKNELRGHFYETTRNNFKNTLDLNNQIYIKLDTNPVVF